MIYALIVAAGHGTRLGSKIPKQYLHLAGRPILSHSLKTFDKTTCIDQLILVVANDQIDHCRSHVLESSAIQKPVSIITGGKRRQDSVYNGLKSIVDRQGIVLIHDGARPMVSSELIEACVEGAKKWGACIPGIDLVDTLKEADSDGFARRTVPRQILRQIQTPQAFDLKLARKAHELARQNHWTVTDDAAMVERMGKQVRIIPGEVTNIKITTSQDLVMAEALCSTMS